MEEEDEEDEKYELNDLIIFWDKDKKEIDKSKKIPIVKKEYIENEDENNINNNKNINEQEYNNVEEFGTEQLKELIYN